MQAVLSHGIEEYNKDFPRLRITLYEVTFLSFFGYFSLSSSCRMVRFYPRKHTLKPPCKAQQERYHRKVLLSNFHLSGGTEEVYLPICRRH